MVHTTDSSTETRIITRQPSPPPSGRISQSPILMRQAWQSHVPHGGKLCLRPPLRPRARFIVLCKMSLRSVRSIVPVAGRLVVNVDTPWRRYRFIEAIDTAIDTAVDTVEFLQVVDGWLDCAEQLAPGSPKALLAGDGVVLLPDGSRFLERADVLLEYRARRRRGGVGDATRLRCRWRPRERPCHGCRFRL